MSYEPGPWRILWETRGAVITARDDCYDVAIVRDIGNSDNKANARLIAAAPTMYEYIEERAAAGDERAAKILEAIHASR